MNFKEQFVGNWKLLSMVNESEDGDNYFPFGKNVSGLLIYTEDYYMSVQVASSERPNFVSEDFRHGTKDEIFKAFNHYVAYTGKYEIDDVRGQIIHHIEISMYPNWSGTRARRYFKFEKNFLTLKATPVEFNNKLYTPTLNWIKIQ